MTSSHVSDVFFHLHAMSVNENKSVRERRSVREKQANGEKEGGGRERGELTGVPDSLHYHQEISRGTRRDKTGPNHPLEPTLPLTLAQTTPQPWLPPATRP